MRVLDVSRVSPPAGSVADAIIPLSFFDVFWLFTDGPVERLFFYRSTISTVDFVDSILPPLKSSLSFILQRFYLLAGSLNRRSDGVVNFEISYTQGDSVSFTVAEYDDDDDGSFNQLLSGGDGVMILDCTKIRTLVPQLPKIDLKRGTNPLLALQVTVLPGRGFTIGIAAHHVACDGLSSTRFVKSWASICRSRVPTEGSLYHRTVIPDPSGLYWAYVQALLKFQPDKAQTLKANVDTVSSSQPNTKTNTVLGSFTLRRRHIERLKQRVEPLRCSTFVVSCAHTWISLVKTRHWANDRNAIFVFMADCRALLRPPLPEAYFGNCLLPCTVEARVGELVGEEGLLSASKAIGRVIAEFRERATEDMGAWSRKSRFDPSMQALGVSGSPKFGVYGADFGWGRPEKVVVSSIDSGDCMSLAESRDESGGVEIGLAMSKHEMDEFRSHFNEGLVM